VREMTLHGIVGKGLGSAAGWMQDDPILSQALKVKLYPGTLNVYVKGNYFLIGDGFDPPSVRRNGKVRALRCTINQRDAFIVRNEHNGPESQDLMSSPRTLFEIVAEACLKDTLRISRGSQVVIDYDPSRITDYYVLTAR
jgi:CTP-dependent riboflavin kinase